MREGDFDKAIERLQKSLALYQQLNRGKSYYDYYLVEAYAALGRLLRLDHDLSEARAQFDQDWFRRIMRARAKAVLRLRRRWAQVYPVPQISLGNLRRRYHANLALYLYKSNEADVLQ